MGSAARHCVFKQDEMRRRRKSAEKSEAET